MNLKEFQAIQKVLSQLERERDETTGALKQLKKELKREFGCNSIKEAKQLKRKLQKEFDDGIKEFKKELRHFFRKSAKSIKHLSGPDIKVLRNFAFPSKDAEEGSKRRKKTKEKNKRSRDS